MKRKIITVTMIMLVFAGISFAQDRQGDPSKTLDRINASRCMTINGATTAQSVVEAIIGPGITYSNVSAQGIFAANPSLASIGFFQGADCVPLGFNEGIILSSGTIGNAIGPNIYSEATAELGLPGDPDLNALIPNYITYDAS